MLKEKIAISIDNSLLKLIDSGVDGTMLRSRSQAIEYYLRKGMSSNSVGEAVLLLKRSHQDIALKQFKGKSLIGSQAEFFIKNGISKIYLITEQPNKELRESLIGMPIEIIESNSRGNSLSLMTFKERVRGNFVVMSGDTYNNFDISRMISKHIQLNKLATMGLMTREKPDEYGTAILDGDLIVDFSEKTREMSSHIVNAGIYIFKPEIFELINKPSLEKDLFPLLARIKELVGFFTYGEYEHFG
ncbi:hypothetical protein J4401_00835 [Candidatus Woesearchaeota archaeon]|nr:hypothetical protein [Candidatus Woesearchaeota archaeon]